MSAESGVPTYRGKGGIWKEYDYEAYACQPAFERDPEAVWEFHNYRRGLIDQCKPNAGHEVIARSEAKLERVTVITQNIDGMHQLAGSTRVHELHGSIWRTRCERCEIKREEREVPLTLLRCKACKGWLRPDVVWFGDSLFVDVLQAAMGALQSCDLLISIGTSAVVYPAAQMPLIAQDAGATLVEINPEDTDLSRAFDHRLRGTATEMLAQLAEGL